MIYRNSIWGPVYRSLCTGSIAKIMNTFSGFLWFSLYSLIGEPGTKLIASGEKAEPSHH